ncbi:3-isopropylmalate dehydratase small subunit [Rhodoligotrophos defluvii]|uniref:3-isopropylmalate dehydratase small subunit n=1 Tax=Rhodoligotrophos defluvii TaxID=2561934 RepID=UPI0010C9D90B|nr:3-isopropylmalate dehydratase small subunit [Rhodoligotrophos defluvii]
MQTFRTLDAVAVPIAGIDIDTDQILPARFMHKKRENYGRYFFHDLRFDGDGTPRDDFILNKPAFRTAKIVVGDRNFGCGSSREQAVHALADFGIRCVIAPSFGDIFQTNCLKNGVLPVVLRDPVVREIREALEAQPGGHLTVDLESETVTDLAGSVHSFSTDPFARSCLLEGLDEIDYSLTLLHRIRAFEASKS